MLFEEATFCAGHVPTIEGTATAEPPAASKPAVVCSSVVLRTGSLRRLARHGEPFGPLCGRWSQAFQVCHKRWSTYSGIFVPWAGPKRDTKRLDSKTYQHQKAVHICELDPASTSAGLCKKQILDMSLVQLSAVAWACAALGGRSRSAQTKRSGYRRGLMFGGTVWNRGG